MSEQYVTISIYVPQRLVERVDRLAEEQRRNRSNMVIVLLEAALRLLEGEQSPPTPESA